MRLARFSKPDVWGWSGLDQLTSLRDEINRLFELPQTGVSSDGFNAWAPSVDVYEDKDNVIVRAELPGLSKKDIDISLHDNAITISGERRSERKAEDGQMSREERFVGRFTRTVSLPKQVEPEKVKATYRDGILTVTLPKAEEAKPRQIKIQTS